MKLQDAFVAESGAYYGSWNKIGYIIGSGTACVAAGGCVRTTSNFEFSEEKDGYVSGTSDLPTSAEVTWAAKNVAKLNDCAIGKNWQLSISKATGNTQGEYSWTVTMGDNCDGLTPNFGNLGNASTTGD